MSCLAVSYFRGGALGWPAGLGWGFLGSAGFVAGSLLVFAMTIGAFVIPRMIGGTTMHVMSLLIDQQMLTTFNYAIGATLAFILLVLVMLYRPQGLMGLWELFWLKRRAAVAKS